MTMRERIKTVLLLVLVMSSIILTGRLLFGQPSLETAAPPAYEQIVFGELRPVTDQVLPWLRLGDGLNWQELQPWDTEYAAAWEALQLLFRYSTERYPAAALPEGLAAPSLFAGFPTAVPPAVWEPSAHLDGLEITELAWFQSERDTVWFRDAQDGWLKSQLTSLPPDWEKTVEEAFTTAPRYRRTEAAEWEALSLPVKNDIFLPIELPFLAPRSVIKESLDTEKLLRSIFVNTALTRRIEERDGAFIYTDGQRGLRLFDYGEMEFTSPKSEPGSESVSTVSALRRSAEYLELMGGWPDHLYIEDLSPGDSPFSTQHQGIYNVTFFSVQHGIRLLGQKPPVKLHFSDRGVIYYNRQIRLLGGETEAGKTMIDPMLAARAVRKMLDESGKDLGISDVFPAYYLRDASKTQSVSYPVWAFVLSDFSTAVIHGQSGQFLAWVD
jgi:hypothetical protein